VAALLLVALPGPSRADDPFLRGIDAVPVKPTPTALSGLTLDGAERPYPHTFHAAMLFDLTTGVLGLRFGGVKLGDLIPLRIDAHLLAAYQFSDALEFALDVPFTLYQWDNMQLLTAQGFAQPGIAPLGVGDIRFVSRYSVLDPEKWPIGLSAVGEMRVNSGDGNSFLGDRAWVFGIKGAVDKSIGPLRVIGNLGALLRPYPGQFLNLFVRNQLLLGVGGYYRLPDVWRLRQFDAFAEANVVTPMEAPFTVAFSDSLRSPFALLIGARAKVYGPIRAELAVGRGIDLDSGYGRESFRVMAAVRYDHDTRDSDGDGVPDGMDGCPEQPEDKDGFKDGDGCPEPDNDGDGVMDPDDQCPDDPGPKALDGCPDRDGDDVPDVVDKCPDVPGPAENEGCPAEEPQVVLEADRIRIKGNIFFDTAEARIQPRSYPMLDEVYTVLKDHPEVGPVRVDGHTDNRGSRPYNLDLSDRRSKAVMEYLIKKGIDPKRLQYRGFGFDKPVASNDTPIGRAKNRRVEFNLLEGGEGESTEELKDTGASVTPQGGPAQEGAKPGAPTPAPKPAPAPAPKPAAPPKRPAGADAGR
jgi:outer membrane protein OmpA-like peptidoglycan-associated protein